MDLQPFGCACLGGTRGFPGETQGSPREKDEIASTRDVPARRSLIRGTVPSRALQAILLEESSSGGAGKQSDLISRLRQRTEIASAGFRETPNIRSSLLRFWPTV